jgi:hypothetical protein
MSKERARQRAKAKAAQKTQKRKPDTPQSAPKGRPEMLGGGSIKSPRANVNAGNQGAVRRGAAR